jgi:hypothetical protein
VDFVRVRMSYGFLRGLGIIIVLNAHAPTEEKSDDSKDSIYEQVFDHFAKHHMKIPLGDSNAQLGRKDIVKPTIGNGSLHQGSNDNGVRIVNLANKKKLAVKSTVFPH